jgi:hypothetical protein
MTSHERSVRSHYESTLNTLLEIDAGKSPYLNRGVWLYFLAHDYKNMRCLGKRVTPEVPDNLMAELILEKMI